MPKKIIITLPTDLPLFFSIITTTTVVCCVQLPMVWHGHSSTAEGFLSLKQQTIQGSAMVSWFSLFSGYEVSKFQVGIVTRISRHELSKPGFYGTPWIRHPPVSWTWDLGHKEGQSLYGGFLKWWYPKMDGLQWKTLLKWMIWGYHYFWKHPYILFHTCSTILSGMWLDWMALVLHYALQIMR